MPERVPGHVTVVDAATGFPGNRERVQAASCGGIRHHARAIAVGSLKHDIPSSLSSSAPAAACPDSPPPLHRQPPRTLHHAQGELGLLSPHLARVFIHRATVPVWTNS